MENNDQNINQPQVQNSPAELPLTTPPSNQTLEKSPSKTRVIFIGIVIFLLLIVAGSVAFFLLLSSNNRNDSESSETKPTISVSKPNGSSSNEVVSTPSVIPSIPKDWKTHTNTEFGFTLNYPADRWVVQESSERGLDGGGTILFTVGKDLVFINGARCLQGKSYEEANMYQGDEPSELYDKLISKKSISFQGKRGFHIETEEVPNNKFQHEVCVYDSTGKPGVGLIYTAFGKDKYEKYKSDFLEMLPTFKTNTE